jgi:hypothetical protein
MEDNRIRHASRHLNRTLFRRLEIEPDIAHCPDGLDELVADCPDCESRMMYRGIGRLGSGTKVHYFECVHSHREVHGLSILVGD